METSFIPLCAIIAVLIIAFLFASLPQVSLKTRYSVLYAIAIIMLFAVIPISILSFMSGYGSPFEVVAFPWIYVLLEEGVSITFL